MSIGKKIRQLRETAKLSQAELASVLGVSDKAVSTWEMEKKTPRMGTLQALADYFGVSKSYLIEDSQPEIPQGFCPLPNMKKIPRVGRIACGEPILAEENIETYDNVPDNWKADFTLICVGDSMAPKIQDGDLVAIRQQEQVENGQIAAVLIDNETTLKRVYVYPDKLILRPENPDYEPIVIMNGESSTIRIEGRAVGFCRGL